MTRSSKDIKREKEIEQIKRAVLAELGYLKRVEREGWKSLNAKECGRVGGLINKRLREQMG